MIERYALYETALLRDTFHLTQGLPKGIKPRYNIAPSQQTPVVVQHGDEIVTEQMQWGFVSQNAKDTNSIFRYKTYNIRSEDIFKKVSWDKAVRTQRCLVPVNGFYVWSKTTNGKQPYFVQAKDRPLIALAGVYSSWTDGEGVSQGMFSIVTVPPNKETRPISDRLPVIIQPHEEKTWLDPTISDMVSLYDIMRTTPHDTLSIRQVGEAVNSVKIDTPSLLR